MQGRLILGGGASIATSALKRAGRGMVFCRPLALALLIGGCTQKPEEVRSADVDCSGHPPPNVQSPQAMPAVWKPWFKDVETRATYTKMHPDDHDPAHPAKVTSLSIAGDLRLHPGDYLGLQSVGRWYYREVDGPDSTTNDLLGAVFVDAKGHFLAPAPSGLQSGFDTPPMYHGNHDKTDIPEDFAVLPQEMIVRIPTGAVEIRFGVSDSAYADNGPVRKFGVTIYEPNRPAGPNADRETQAMAGKDEEGDMLALVSSLPRAGATIPVAKSFADNPFSNQGSGDLGPQWRGNYMGHGWDPKRSQYRAPRDNKKYHWGWDIFSPKGSQLISPVWPARLDIPPWSEDFGNTVFLTFKAGGEVWHVGYAHLDRVIGQSRLVTGPEPVAYSGCTGPNSIDVNGCGTNYPNGTRNDHVHVGLYSTKAVRPADAMACDPGGLLAWKIQ